VSQEVEACLSKVTLRKLAVKMVLMQLSYHESNVLKVLIGRLTLDQDIVQAYHAELANIWGSNLARHRSIWGVAKSKGKNAVLEQSVLSLQ
jgi:hypothetical protein